MEQETERKRAECECWFTKVGSKFNSTHYEFLRNLIGSILAGAKNKWQELSSTVGHSDILHRKMLFYEAYENTSNITTTGESHVGPDERNVLG